MSSTIQPEYIIQHDNISYISLIAKYNMIMLSTDHGNLAFYSLDNHRIIREFKTDGKDLIFGDYILDTEQDITVEEFFNKIKLLCHFKDGNIIVYEIFDNQLKPIRQWKATTVCFARCFMERAARNGFGFLSGEGKDSFFEVVDLKQDFQSLKLSFDATNHGVITDSYYWINADRSNIMVLFADETGKMTLYEHKMDAWNIIVKLSTLQLFEELILCFDFHPELRRGIAGTVGDEIVAWNLDHTTENFELVDNKRIKLPTPGTLCISIRADGRIFATASKDGQIRILSFKTAKILATIPFHSSTIKSMKFDLINHNNYHLFVADNHALLSVWSLYNDNDSSDETKTKELQGMN